MVVNKKKILDALRKAKESSGKIRFLKKGTTHHLKILEYEDSDGDMVFAQRVVEHFPIAGQGKGAICRAEVFGKPCAYCQINRVASEAGQPPVYRFRNRYMVNAIDIDNNSKKVQLWSFPVTVFEEIATAVVSEEWEDILEAKKGHGFTITREGEGLETTYATNPMRKPYPVKGKLLKQVVDPMEEIIDPGLDSQCEALNQDKEELFEDVDLEAVEDGEEEETPKKGKKKKSSKKKSKKKEEEEEEEEPDEEDIDETDDEEEEEDGEEEEEDEEEEEEDVDDDEEEDEEEATKDADDGEDAEDDEEEGEEYLCLGDPDYYEPDSECDSCKVLKECKKLIKKKLNKGKAKKEEEGPKKKKKGGRGRPAGSKNKVNGKTTKKTGKGLAKDITGGKKKKKKKSKK